MSQTGTVAFDSTLQTTNIWLEKIMEEMGWLFDRHRATTHCGPSYMPCATG